jgi:aryl-alcohol dehydrogenase-like predicted oxidoreductase
LEYRRLGQTGLKVSPLCLGTVNFPDRTPYEEAAKIIHHALDAGINFIDTANVYSQGRSEEAVGKALKGRRQEVVLATKVRGQMGDGPNDVGLSRRHILEAVDGSLRRLQTDHIDLYQLHQPDADTPIEETLSALTDIVRAGKVRYIGTSNFAAWQIAHANGLSALHGWERFVSEQPQYSLLNRHVEAELVPFANAHGVAILPWSPLAGGLLSGRYRIDTPTPAGSRRDAEFWMPGPDQIDRRLALVERLAGLAAEIDVPLSQFALSWVVHRPGVTSPIIGPRTMEHLQDNLAALSLDVSAAALETIDAWIPAGSIA